MTETKVLEYSINMTVEDMFEAIQLGHVTRVQFEDWLDEIKDLHFTKGVLTGLSEY